MSKVKVQSVESAREQIVDMLASLGEDESPGFSKWALDKDSVELLHVSRSEDGKQGKIVVEMLVTERMSNQLGNMHGGSLLLFFSQTLARAGADLATRYKVAVKQRCWTT